MLLEHSKSLLNYMHTMFKFHKSQFVMILTCSGYMSPEYVMDGIFSVKSDVFSFGVLVLEIVSGQRNKGFFSLEPC